MQGAGSSWLIPAESDRQRMLDMDRRLQPFRRAALGVLAVVLLACGPWLGWWTLAPLVLAGVLFAGADARMEAAERPEYAIFGAWVASEVIIGASIAISGGPTIATMSWFAIPLVTLTARFSMRGIVIGVSATILLLLAVAFGVDASAVIHNPPLVLAPLALVIAIAILSTALMDSDVHHRSEAVIDPLTGLLNRNALTRRVNELTQQSEISGERVGLVLGDLDGFKSINDAAGHSVGDGVLKDVAYCLRKELRAFDLAYRYGGEEFVVLVPGADADETAEIAERLREAVSESCKAHPVTMSLGTSTSASGSTFDFDRVFAEADAAMYEAKREGGNRVRRSDMDQVEAEIIQIG